LIPNEDGTKGDTKLDEISSIFNLDSQGKETEKEEIEETKADTLTKKHYLENEEDSSKIKYGLQEASDSSASNANKKARFCDSQRNNKNLDHLTMEQIKARDKVIASRKLLSFYGDEEEEEEEEDVDDI
jgi:hypothetical protein